MPIRRSTSINAGWVPRPAPRLTRSVLLRSKTTASQPIWRMKMRGKQPAERAADDERALLGILSAVRT